MKVAGTLLIILGLVGAMYGFNMDTTVAASDTRVHNLGLLANRQTVLILSGVTFLGGAILAAIPGGHRKD